MSESGPVSVDLDIEADRTTITVRGDRDAAVVVRSESGERIYLPPEDFERAARDGTAYGSAEGADSSDSPYQSASADSPYQSSESDSPYQSASSDSPYQSPGATQTPGLEATADGFRIVHPEEVTDFRLLR